MEKNQLHKLYIALGIALLLAALFFLRGGRNEQLTQADARYAEGEKAQTIAAREEAFNRALADYYALEAHYRPDFGNGKLYFNLGNTYYQLGQYPLAVLNYYKALKLMPKDEKVRENLKIAHDKLGIKETTEHSAFENVFFFHHYFSLPERLQLFFWLTLLLLAFGSWYLWTQRKEAKTAIALALIPWLFVLLSLGYTRYISPVEGVLLSATDLHRDAGLQYAKVSDQPLQEGSKVEVLETAPNGKWLKVVTKEGQIGYVAQDSIRLI